MSPICPTSHVQIVVLSSSDIRVAGLTNPCLVPKGYVWTIKARNHLTFYFPLVECGVALPSSGDRILLLTNQSILINHGDGF